MILASISFATSEAIRIIAAAIAVEPRLEPRVYKNGKLFVGIFVNDRNMRALGGLEAPVSDGDVIRVLPPIAGG